MPSEDANIIVKILNIPLPVMARLSKKVKYITQLQFALVCPQQVNGTYVFI